MLFPAGNLSRTRSDRGLIFLIINMTNALGPSSFGSYFFANLKAKALLCLTLMVDEHFCITKEIYAMKVKYPIKEKPPKKLFLDKKRTWHTSIWRVGPFSLRILDTNPST